MKRSRDMKIDRDKVRAEARKLDGTGLRVWLDRAIDRLADEAFPELIADYVHLRDVLADEATPPDLLGSIREFHRESMAGRYYQSFNVNSRNCMEMSRGTEIFIAEHSRLVEACLRAERSGELETAAEGLGLLIDLLREIDECETTSSSSRTGRVWRSRRPLGACAVGLVQEPVARVGRQ
ncbi:MAG: hypothetical protein R3F39_10205 [Myxococcota bacterium]